MVCKEKDFKTSMTLDNIDVSRNLDDLELSALPLYPVSFKAWAGDGRL